MRREGKTLIRIFKNLALATLLVLSIHVPAFASNSVLLVGVSPTELNSSENGLLAGKELVNIPFSYSWLGNVKQIEPSSIILRQPSGFVGLYDPKGNLIRQVSVIDPVIDSEYNYSGIGKSPYLRQDASTNRWDVLGYTTGGRRNQYSGLTNEVIHNNHPKLAPGWGYNSQVRNGSSNGGPNGGGIKNALLSFVSLLPTDAATPFNYPGTYTQLGISGGYAFGALPHIGGLAAQVVKARDNQAQYNRQSNPVPYYSEAPPQAYTNFSKTNPISYGNGAAAYGNEPLGQAFRTNFPVESREVDYYRTGY